MKTWNINPTDTKIADFSIRAISLGEKGRGRQQAIVPCPNEDCTLMEPGLSKTGKPRLNKSTSDRGWLLRVSTEGAYIRGANGNVSVHPQKNNRVKVIASGQGAFGAAGRTGTWDDLLLSVDADENCDVLLRVKPSRGPAYLLLVTLEKVIKLSYEEADAIDVDYGESSASSRGDFIRL